jgi:hypothetical protein
MRSLIGGFCKPLGPAPSRHERYMNKVLHRVDPRVSKEILQNTDHHLIASLRGETTDMVKSLLT